MKLKHLFVVGMLFGTPSPASAQLLPYQNPSLSAEERAEDLCKRLTLEEKSLLMMNSSPAIERLGIPAFDWWSEALHGVGRNGLATVFPSCIGMAASFDDDLIEEVFTAVSDEARAKNTLARKEGKSENTNVCHSGLQILMYSVTRDGDADRKLMEKIPI